MKKSLYFIILAAIMCTCIAVTGEPVYAGTNDSMNSGTVQDSWGLNLQLNENVKEVKIDSSEAVTNTIVPIDKDFTSADGKTLRVTMTGLNNENQEHMLDALEEFFRDSGDDSDIPIKVEDASFIDAEKWDNSKEQMNEYFYGYDASHCWAASCANMLWLSGWASQIINPRTERPFQSEDDLFEYYNVCFSDRGSDADRGLDWFFMGEYFVSGVSACADTRDDRAGGFMKSFVSTMAQTQYDLTETPEDIGRMLSVAADNTEERCVFELAVGSMDSNELSNSIHAVTGIGLITDPNAVNTEDKYKAIILSDSDNDSHPSDEEIAERDRIMAKFNGLEPFSEESKKVSEELVEYKESRKEIRPNSYTVYKLRFCRDDKGRPYWKILGYVDDETYAIYTLNELPCPSDKIINDCTETEGSADVNEDVDFTLDHLFTTSNEESMLDPYMQPASEAKKYEFEKGEPVNINYFLANRSNVILNDSYPGGNLVTIDWKVTRDKDGTAVSSGSVSQAFNNYRRLEIGGMLFLNKTDSGYLDWLPGDYTVTVSFNKDKKFRESYYKNNVDKTLHFKITGDSEQQDPDTPKEDTSKKDTSKEDTPKNETSEARSLKVNTLKVSGKTVKLKSRLLKKKDLIIPLKKAISVSKAKGTVRYKKIQVSVKNKRNKYVKSAKYTKKIIFDNKTRKIKVKKGIKKGKYKIKVKVTADGDKNYKAANKTVIVMLHIR